MPRVAQQREQEWEWEPVPAPVEQLAQRQAPVRRVRALPEPLREPLVLLESPAGRRVPEQPGQVVAERALRVRFARNRASPTSPEPRTEPSSKTLDHLSASSIPPLLGWHQVPHAASTPKKGAPVALLGFFHE